VLKVREVAELLRISTATVYKLCASGKIAHERVSNSIRIGRAELEAFWARNLAGKA
jgi:excisionase family DNA binding protein